MQKYDDFELLNLLQKITDKGLVTILYTHLLLSFLLGMVYLENWVVAVFMVIFSLILFQYNFNTLADNEFNLYRYQYLASLNFMTFTPWFFFATFAIALQAEVLLLAYIVVTGLKWATLRLMLSVKETDEVKRPQAKLDYEKYPRESDFLLFIVLTLSRFIYIGSAPLQLLDVFLLIGFLLSSFGVQYVTAKLTPIQHILPDRRDYKNVITVEDQEEYYKKMKED